MNTPETFLEAFAGHVRANFSDSLYCYAGYTGLAGALLVKIKRVDIRAVLRPWLRDGPVGLQDITRSLERYKNFRGQLPSTHVHIAHAFRDNALRQVAQSTFQALIALDPKRKAIAVTGTRNLPTQLLEALISFCDKSGIEVSYDFVGMVMHRAGKRRGGQARVAEPASERPQVFVSYSWDSDTHKLWVLRLAAALMRNGVRALIDEWDLASFNDDMNLFMEAGIRDSNNVLVVCTPQYARKANARAGGVGVESSIITGELYDKAKAGKFIAIARGVSGDLQSCLPSYLKSRFVLDFSDDRTYGAQFESLLRRLLRKPEYRRPELGPLPDLDSQDI